MPETEQEIVSVVLSGSLEEAPGFDAKEEIPTNNHDTAKDIAAMTVDGGVIIYGIAEDEDGKPIILNPIPLAGRIERITAIARTSIQEPPDIVSWEIRTQNDASRGYIVVVVPASERAPHMVVVRNNNRFYGRLGKQNVVLSEGEVARLYERRHQLEISAHDMMEQVIQSAPLIRQEGFGYLHLFSSPLLSDEGFLERAVNEGETLDQVLHLLVAPAREGSVFRRDAYIPDFLNGFPDRWERTVDGIKGNLAYPAHTLQPLSPEDTLILRLKYDGSASLFSGRVAATSSEGEFLLISTAIAGLTLRFLNVVSSLYERANYPGTVVIGVGVTGIQGAQPITGRHLRGGYLYESEDYRRTTRISSLILQESQLEIARRLLERFFETLFQGLYDPFTG